MGAFVRINWSLVCVCIIWSVITLFLVVFQCRPIRAAWRIELQLKAGAATCVNSSKMIFGFEIANMVIDVAILVPSIRVVNKLQLKPAKRAGVMGMFLLGLL